MALRQRAQSANGSKKTSIDCHCGRRRACSLAVRSQSRIQLLPQRLGLSRLHQHPAPSRDTGLKLMASKYYKSTECMTTSRETDYQKHAIPVVGSRRVAHAAGPQAL